MHDAEAAPLLTPHELINATTRESEGSREKRGAMAWWSRPLSASMATGASVQQPAFEMGELQSQLRSADLHGAMQILQSLLNDKQLDAATKEALKKIARQWVSEGCSSQEVTAFDKDGWTPLYRATYSGYTEIVRLLLEAHVDVDATTIDGRAPLHHASHAGDAAIVRLLLQAHADANIMDKDGRTPIHIASSTGRAEVVRLLIDAKADVQPRNAAGMTPLHRAKTPAIARYLLEGGASPNAVNKIGWNSLHAACARLRYAVASVLTASASNLNTGDNSGYLPIHLALLYIWFTGSSVKALKTLQVLVTSGSVWDTMCDAIADQVAPWPTCWIRRDTADQCWQQEAPAIRACVERWMREHKQGLPLTEVPVEQVRNGLEDTQIFIQALAESREVKFRRKICVVGPSNWGKTSLVKSLTTQQPSLAHPDDRTIGIDHFILTFEEQVAGLNAIKKHEVTFWDFAGQDSYQTAHSLFFSARTLYIVVIDLESYVTAKMQAELMTDTESETDRWMNEFVETRVLQWIRLICARQGDAEFVFVATKKDRVVNANLGDSKRGNGDDGVLRDLQSRLENVAVIIEAMKDELEKKSSARHDPVTVGNVTEPTATMPITHLGDERLERVFTKPSVRIIVTSCATSKAVDALKLEIQDIIKQSDRSFPMPDKFTLVLADLLRMRSEAIKSATDKRIARTFRHVHDLIQLLVDTIRDPVVDDERRLSSDHQEPYLDKRTCRTILQTLRDLGDVLWYDTIEDELLKDTIIVDPRLMIDLVRDVFDHHHTSEVMTHHTLKGLTFWRHLSGSKSMLSMKRVLQHFFLVYPTTGTMLIDSDLIVPAYWKTNTSAFWMFGGGDLRFGGGVHREEVAVRVHFEYQFVNNYPCTLFDHAVVVSYSPFVTREVGPDWIMYKEQELHACRLMVGRDQETHHPTLHLEALQGHSADEEAAEQLWERFTLLFESLEKVIGRYPGVMVTRYAREDTDEELLRPTRYTLETLQRFKLSRSARKWMPPQQTWEACLNAYKT